MEKYNITGMSCAACSARVEKAVSEVDGVTECSVNLLTNSMIVEGTADSAAIITAVENAGYGASKDGEKRKIEDIDGHSELKKMKSLEEENARLKRLVAELSLEKMVMSDVIKNFSSPD